MTGCDPAARTDAPPPVTPAAVVSVSGAAPGAGSGRVETLERLAALRSSGALSDEEFQAGKARVMNNGT